MIQFYSEDLESTSALPADESAHCCRVLRKQEGDEIIVVDGKGNRFLCRILDANPRNVKIEVVEKETTEKHWKNKIILAVSPTKNSERIEWLVEKAVEIGVDEIVFFKCERSERKVLKTDRLERIAVSAMKQSLKARKPLLSELINFTDFLKSNLPRQKMMAYCGDACEKRDFAKEYNPSEDVVILIGPEGDFSPSEVEATLKSGFMGVTFGNCRLRTETAALYGVTAAHVLADVVD